MSSLSASISVTFVSVAIASTLIGVAVSWRNSTQKIVPSATIDDEDDTQYVAVFCGSKPGKHPEYAEAARLLGKEIVRRGYGLVYGGGSVGLMGEIARSVDEAGGKVLGVIPRALMPREFTGKLIQVENVIVTQTMHERKTIMANKASVFVTLPGGNGTFEEFFEAVTWSQLGIHRKPCGLLNVKGYYDSIDSMLKRAIEDGFVLPVLMSHIVMVEADPVIMLDRLLDADVPASRVTGWHLPAMPATELI